MAVCFSRVSRAAMVATAMILSGCAGAPASPGQGAVNQARTELPRPLTVPEQRVRTAANAFSFALWQKLNANDADTNIFVSPLSASFALGMAMNGAAGTTLDEMRSALQFSDASVTDIDAGYESLIELLTTLDASVTMQIANSIWYRNTLTVNKPFVDVVSSTFGATVTPLDFTDAAASLGKINGWVDANTNHKIPTILDEIRPDAMMYLINAIYFKAGWRTKFDPELTKNEPFHGRRGDRTVALMHREGDLPYTETPLFQAVDLPYGDSAFTMTVILPRESSSVDAVAASLTAESWSALTDSYHQQLVRLALPRLRMEWQASLVPELTALGMHAAFVDADFTPLSPLGRQLVISDVRQKAFVDVNEEGTEAAAVTSVGIVVTSAPLARTMRVDRPFIFAIRERLTGTVLFLGKVQDL